MDLGLLGQFVVNGLMLGMMYALVAVGFTLFFGVLDVIKFSHGDVLTVGAFAGLSTWLGLLAHRGHLALAADRRGRAGRDFADGPARRADREVPGAAAEGARHRSTPCSRR